VKQVTQRLRDGRIEVADVPSPELRPEGVLVAVRSSLLSTGTERKKVETGKQSLIGKARSRPDDVRKVVEKARRDGLAETIQAVRTRLAQPGPLGYSSAGVVIAAGSRVSDLAPGDRVACGGGGYAVHAEIEYVPANLAVPLPDGVDFDAGAFATVGSIALHGVRQADVRLGETVTVIGLGLVGQLTGQILRAAGCRVLGIDVSDDAVADALRCGAANRAFPPGAVPGDVRGTCDAVVIAAATSSSDPVRLAADLCRDRGRVVVVGDVGMDVPRGLYYDKELELRTSRSYGPGRYDLEYEERGLDYPVGYVRWTERRNMAAFLELVADGRVDVAALISERVPIEDAVDAYERLASGQSRLGIVFRYAADDGGRTDPPTAPRAASTATGTAGVIGAGSFATRVLIPAISAAGFRLGAIASASGLSARSAAEQFGFARAASVDDVLADPALECIAIATRHASHAALASAALRAGKAVFVEKPPALTEAELDGLRAARDETGLVLAVGFNRRHAPLAVDLREHIRREGEPLQLVYRVNAGRLPDDHWLNDIEDGGGRLLGEGCHFVDFACWTVGSLPERVAFAATADRGRALAAAQSFTVILTFADGSVATILYSADGADTLAKEYVEAHAGGRSAVLDDFRRLTLAGPGRNETQRPRGQDKGHRAQLVAFRSQLMGGPAPAVDPLGSMAATLAALRAAETGEPVAL
jgi:predicted dehydrogenase/threonine dehydrogenase-like Zn-dependent dehydrogenase